jgi:trans-aconitate 2-methyltransferase
LIWYQYLDIKILYVNNQYPVEGRDMWDAGQYLRFGGERARPFFDLVAQVGATSPRYVADLGCGPGNLTAALAARWPEAAVVGVDNSPEMIAAARAAAEIDARGPAAAPNLSFALGDVRDWRPERPLDVLVCNAVLQWVPGHDELLLRWADLLAPGGWLAFQLPGNFDQPSHAIVRELAASPRWRGPLAGARLNRQAGDPAGYVALLTRPGFEVDAWETSYLHVLHGDNPVLEWTKGTTLRPVLAALDAEQAAAFVGEYAERLRAEYQPHPFGTVFPFRRVFAVVHRADVSPG